MFHQRFMQSWCPWGKITASKCSLNSSQDYGDQHSYFCNIKAQPKGTVYSMYGQNLSSVLHVFGWESVTDHLLRQEEKCTFSFFCKMNVCNRNIQNVILENYFLNQQVLIIRDSAFCFYNDFISCFSDLLTFWPSVTSQMKYEVGVIESLQLKASLLKSTKECFMNS